MTKLQIVIVGLVLFGLLLWSLPLWPHSVPVPKDTLPPLHERALELFILNHQGYVIDCYRGSWPGTRNIYTDTYSHVSQAGTLITQRGQCREI
jgi:hypothetical protein